MLFVPTNVKPSVQKPPCAEGLWNGGWNKGRGTGWCLNAWAQIPLSHVVFIWGYRNPVTASILKIISSLVNWLNLRKSQHSKEKGNYNRTKWQPAVPWSQCRALGNIFPDNLLIHPSYKDAVLGGGRGAGHEVRWTYRAHLGSQMACFVSFYLWSGHRGP